MTEGFLLSELWIGVSAMRTPSAAAVSQVRPVMATASPPNSTGSRRPPDTRGDDTYWIADQVVTEPEPRPGDRPDLPPPVPRPDPRVIPPEPAPERPVDSPTPGLFGDLRKKAQQGILELVPEDIAHKRAYVNQHAASLIAQLDGRRIDVGPRPLLPDTTMPIEYQPIEGRRGTDRGRLPQVAPVASKQLPVQGLFKHLDPAVQKAFLEMVPDGSKPHWYVNTHYNELKARLGGPPEDLPPDTYNV